MQWTSKSAITSLLVLAGIALTGCRNHEAKSAWSDIVKNCAKSDLNAKQILYFGPSNNVGPASIWRSASDGGYRLRWTTAEMPGIESTVQKGSDMSCSGVASRDFSGKASAGLVSEIAPASGELAGEFGRARTISVTANALSWDTLKEGPFEQYLKNLPEGNPIKEELATDSRLIAVRALRVSGFSADLKFSATDAAELKAKYKGQLPAQLNGELNAGVEGKWTDETTLKITAQDFYIAGELGKYTAGGFAGVGESISDPVEVGAKPSVGRDNT